MPPQYETYQYQKDTIIIGNTYKKVKDVNSSKFALFREDILLKKVYQFSITNAQEYLYMDFALNVGNGFNVNINGTITTTTVTIKDSMLINGSYHNKFTLSPSSGINYDFTEGILSIKNPLDPWYWGGEPQVYMVCECHNGQFYYYDTGGFNNWNCNLTCTSINGIN